jgi:hypothetical protein
MKGINYLKNKFYILIIGLLLLSCSKEEKQKSRLNPEIMNFVKKYEQFLKKEKLFEREKYIICAYVENSVDTIKVNVDAIHSWEALMKLGQPIEEDSVGKTKVYIYAPQLQYLFADNKKVKFDSKYFLGNDTLSLHCMILNLTLKKFGKDSVVTYEAYNSPIFIKLAPPPPPKPVKFEPIKISK